MKYISLLRGINVGGQKKIKMLDLKSLYDDLGFTHVLTYIQSGNVIFESKDKRAESIKKTIEAEIEKRFTFSVPVEIKTAAQWNKVLHQFPFTDVDQQENGTKLLVTFLSDKLSKPAIENLTQYVIAPERLAINDNILYLYCPNGYGKTKLSNTFIEKKLGVSATTRNWKTVLKLGEMSTLN